MNFIVNPKFDHTCETVINIDRSRCDGCAICIDVCPSQALTVIDNRSRPGHKIVNVTPKLCLGCGVCQATCPKEALAIPGISPGELHEMVETILLETGAKKNTPNKTIDNHNA